MLSESRIEDVTAAYKNHGWKEEDGPQPWLVLDPGPDASGCGPASRAAAACQNPREATDIDNLRDALPVVECGSEETRTEIRTVLVRDTDPTFRHLLSTRQRLWLWMGKYSWLKPLRRFVYKFPKRRT